MLAARQTGWLREACVAPRSTSAVAASPIAAFNALRRSDCLALLHSLLDISSWAEKLCDGRPFPSVDALIVASGTAGATTTQEEILGALHRHPRIGARLSDGSAESAWSEREQAAVRSDEAAAADLAAGNALYEARFGFIYLVRAAGRSARELIDLLHSRLDNERDQEISVVRGELLDIAELRIRALMVS
jgi:2-oxo-4-hydroxy-4-carboxy-5-ureidoimidazoline decarboxylase